MAKGSITYIRESPWQRSPQVWWFMIKLAVVCAIIGAVLANWPQEAKSEVPSKAKLAAVCGTAAK